MTAFTVAVLVTAVTVAVGAIAATRVNTALPVVSDAVEHVTVPPAPTAGVEQDQPLAAVSETNVVASGSVSDSVTDAAALGPLLVTVMVYVRLWPTVAEFGVPIFVIERSAIPATGVVAVAELFSGARSVVTAFTVAVLVTAVTVAVGAIATTRVNCALPVLSDAVEHATVPPAPTAGVEQDQPPAAVSETNVVAGGSVSDNVTDAAAFGPLLVTVMVYVRFWPTVAEFGVPIFVMLRSARSNAVVAKYATTGSRLVNRSAVALLSSSVSG